ITMHLPPPSTLSPYTTLFRSSTHQHSGSRNVTCIYGITQSDIAVTRRRHVPYGGKTSLQSQSSIPGADQRLARHREAQALIANIDRKSTRLNSSHGSISYAVF